MFLFRDGLFLIIRRLSFFLSFFSSNKIFYSNEQKCLSYQKKKYNYNDANDHEQHCH